MKRKRRRKERWPGFVVLAAMVAIFGCATTGRTAASRAASLEVPAPQDEAREEREALAELSASERGNLVTCQAALHRADIGWAEEGTPRRRAQDEHGACLCACGDDPALRALCRRHHLPTTVANFGTVTCEAALDERLQQLTLAQATAERAVADLDASRSEQIARINSDHATIIAGMNARLAAITTAPQPTSAPRSGANQSPILDDDDVLANLPNNNVPGIRVASARPETRAARRPRPSAPHPSRPVPAVRPAASVQPIAPVSRPAIVLAAPARIVPARVVAPFVSASVPVTRVYYTDAGTSMVQSQSAFPDAGAIVRLPIHAATPAAVHASAHRTGSSKWLVGGLLAVLGLWLVVFGVVSLSRRRTATPVAASTEVEIDDIEFAVWCANLVVGQSRDFEVIVEAQGHELSGVPVSWSSSDSRVLTVDQQGTVTAIAPGTARIRAKAGNFWDEKEVTVEPQPPRTRGGTI